MDGVPAGDDLEPHHAKPETTTVTYTNEHGDSRDVVEGTRFDGRGRVVEHTAADGTVTTYTYDDVVPEGFHLPIGLLVEEDCYDR